MDKKYVSGIGGLLLILGMLVISIFLGLVLGFVTLEWWKNLMFEGVYGAPAIMFVVIPVAFVVPFLCTLAIQLCLWLFIKQSRSRNEN